MALLPGGGDPLQPANFVQSTHLEKLQTEATAAAPPALSEGVSVGCSAGGEGSGWNGVPLYRAGSGRFAGEETRWMWWRI